MEISYTLQGFTRVFMLIKTLVWAKIWPRWEFHGLRTVPGWSVDLLCGSAWGIPASYPLCTLPRKGKLLAPQRLASRAKTPRNFRSNSEQPIFTLNRSRATLSPGVDTRNHQPQRSRASPHATSNINIHNNSTSPCHSEEHRVVAEAAVSAGVEVRKSSSCDMPPFFFFVRATATTIS